MQFPLTVCEKAEKLLIWSNEQLEDKQWGDATNFKKAMAALGIKMMMLYGLPPLQGYLIILEH